MHKLVEKLLAKATQPSGEIDLEALTASVDLAFEEADRDRRRTDRSIALMVDELEALNRSLEDQVAKRTLQLHERESQLREQNVRFDAAINNMSQGLIMFDMQGRVVLCNRRYAEMYGLSEAQVAPGTSHAGVLLRRTANRSGQSVHH